MFRPLHLQIGIALAGSLLVLGLLGSLALRIASTSLSLYNRVYVEGVVGVPEQLNPLLQGMDSPSSQADLAALLFEGLTRPGLDGTPQPALAEDWIIDTSGRVYTFTLRSGARWHDAAPVTSADVVFTIQSVQHADFASPVALTEVWRDVQVEAVDEYHVRFTLPEPLAPFLEATSLPILPQHLLEDFEPSDWANAPFSQRPIGAGPFRLESLNATQAVLLPFENASRGRPKLDVLVLRFYASVNAAREALRRGDVQGVAYQAAPGTTMEPLPDDMQSVEIPLGAYTSLTFNTQDPVLSDVRLRQTLALGLDRAELIRRVLNGQGYKLDTPLLPQSVLHGATALPAADPRAAAQALNQLGWQRRADGLRARNGAVLRLPLFVAESPGQLALGSEVVRQWRALGVDVALEPQNPAALRSRLQERQLALAIYSWRDLAGDPDLYTYWHSSQIDVGANFAGIADADMDRLLEASRQAVELEERQQLYQEWEERWLALIPSLPLYQSMLVYEFAPSVEPLGLDRTRFLRRPSARFDTISEWTVANPEAR